MTVTGGVLEYRIYQDDVQIGTSATNSFNVTGLTTATTYQFEVTAVSVQGEVESERSNAVSVTTA